MSDEPSAVPSGPYAGQRIALLTRHGKRELVAPVLEPALGCRIELVDGFDTDRLGSFTREIPRAGTQLEAARKKARIGMELAGLSLGLASEGAFGPDPMLGMFPWNVELLLFLDDERGLELIGLAQGRAPGTQVLTADWAEVERFARALGFPAHWLVLRPQHQDDPRIRKDIHDWAGLEAAFASARAEAENGQVFVEPDLRAHANPARQTMIRRAAEDLRAKLLSACPHCGSPGFWQVEQLAGLPCAACGAPTRVPQAERLACPRCGHRLTRPLPGAVEADPGRCDYCNP